MTPSALAGHVGARLSGHFRAGDRVGVAVSGGGDSVALLHLADGWARDQGVSLHVATVDHGLRPEAAAEARMVAAACQKLGLPHATLHWAGLARGPGNLQDLARTARYDLLSQWARDGRLTGILLGHTLDDQAETVILRIARGSGVDGLAAMTEARRMGDVLWLRPLLGVRRAVLRDWLRREGHNWTEDPGNDDPGFDRVRVRQAAETLVQIGLTPERLAGTAAAMARAREALCARAHAEAERLCTVTCGVVSFDLDGLLALDAETRLRLVSHGLRWTASKRYRPRLASVETALAQAVARQQSTLHGCVLVAHGERLVVAREYADVASQKARAGHKWDSRWTLGHAGRGGTVRALGPEGVRIVNPRPRPLPRAALLSLPGLWSGDTLIAVPALSWGVSAEIYTAPTLSSFLSGLIPH